MAIYYKADSGGPDGMVWDRENAVWVDDAIPQTGHEEIRYNRKPALDAEGKHIIENGALIMADDADNPVTEWIDGIDVIAVQNDLSQLRETLRHYGFPLGELATSLDRITAVQTKYAPDFAALDTAALSAMIDGDQDVLAEKAAIRARMTAEIKTIQEEVQL